MSQVSQIAVKVLTGSQTGQIFLITDNAFIGSAPHCDICLVDSGLADMHARIGVRGNIFTLTDLTEEADIRVNKMRVKSRRLAIGDDIDIAGLKMVVIDPLADTIKLDDLDEDPILVVGVEDNPETEIEIPAPLIGMNALDKKADNEDFSNSKVENLTPEDTQDYGSAIDRRKNRKKRISNDWSVSTQERSKGVPWVWIFAALFIVLAVAAWFVVNGVKARNKLAGEYMEVVNFAEANSGDQEEVLRRYRELRSKVAGKYAAVETALDVEITRIEREKADRENAFSDLLASLDKRAQELMSNVEFDKAVEVYLAAPKEYLERILVLRKQEISNIESEKAKVLARKERELKVFSEERELISRKREEEALGQLGVDVVNALLANQNQVAIDLLEKAVEDGVYASSSERIAAALSMVKLLDSYDKLQRAKIEAGDVSFDKSQAREGLTPVARTILFVRDGDLLAARSAIKMIDDHILVPALRARVLESKEDFKEEREAMVNFLVTWRKVVGVPENKIPKPEVCIAIIEEEIKKGTRKDFKELCAGLIECRRQFSSTEFVKRYASLFDFVNQQYPSLLVADVGVADAGNGKIIQVDGTTCFVESTVDVGGVTDGQVALFAQEEQYYAVAASRRPLGARINVTDVYSFKALGQRQLTFELGGSVVAPKIGQSVLIGKDIAKGMHFITTRTGLVDKSVISDDFSGAIGAFWHVGAGSEVSVKSGKLVLTPTASSKSSKRKDRDVKTVENTGKMGHLEFVAGITKGGVSVEFDLARDSVGGVSVAVGDLSFVIGTDGSYQEGIYINGRLAVAGDLAGIRYGALERIAIKCSGGSASLSVNGKSVYCGISMSDYGSLLDRILFFTSGPINIDNFRLMNMDVEDENAAQVIGLAQGGEEVVVRRGKGSSWNALSRGHPVYFFRKDPVDDFVPVVAGSVGDINGEYLVCLVKKGHGLDGDCLVSTSSKYEKSAVVVSTLGDPVKKRGVVADVVSYASVIDDGGTLKMRAELPVCFAPQAYVYSAGDIIRHPKNGEVLAVAAVAGAKIALQQSRSMVSGETPVMAPAAKHGGGLLLSAQPQRPGGFVDICGQVQSSLRGGYSMLNIRKGLWSVDTRFWELQNGGRLRTVSKKVEGYALLPSTQYMPGNFQCEFNIRVESVPDGAVDQERLWVKDVMVELFSPAIMGGVTFGLGAAGNGGMWIGGRSLSLPRTGPMLNGKLGLPKNVTEDVAAIWQNGVPALNQSKEYVVRVRRIGDLILFYLNGKRLASVRYPGLTGDVMVIVGAPRGELSIGRASIRDIPWSCKPVDEEGEFGDFGYVLRTEGQKIWVDADMYGIEPGGKVTVMEVSNVIRGESSKTVILKKVVSGTVVELGGRTAVVMLSGADPDVKPEMKVLSGVQPDSLVVTDEWLRNIDQGL